ncbi:MAG TPA: hypothetical protein VGM02_07360 [Acidobacteriaceae bacterium]|jgi:flagellar export protein FliJ
MRRLLGLRFLEEEREEAGLRRQRQLKQECLNALERSEERKALATRALHAGLESGDRAEAIFAEMALACGPMERRILQRRLTQLDATVEMAAAAWRDSRIRRMQVETLLERAETNDRRKAMAREQKSLDGWFLSSRPQGLAARADESFQRERPEWTSSDGTGRATSVHE